MRKLVHFCFSLALIFSLASMAVGQEAIPDIRRGVVGFMPLDGTLVAVSPDGAGVRAGFERSSQAYDAALQAYGVHEPRYVEGRFGTGIWIEPGFEGSTKHNARNYFDRAAAEMLKDGTGALGYTAVGNAVIEQVTAVPGQYLGTTAPILVGSEELKVICRQAGDGIISIPSDETIPGSYTVSLFARNDGADAAVLKLELIGPDEQVLDEGEIAIAPIWMRQHLILSRGQFSRNIEAEERYPLRLRITSNGPLSFRIDGVVLEMNHGFSYAAKQGVSSWLPGHGYRASESLSVNELAPVFEKGEGSVAFWCKQIGERQGRRVLFELATGNRWQPVLQLYYENQNNLVLTGGGNTRGARFAAEFPVESWHHISLAWSADSATVYVDGKELGTADGFDLATTILAVRLGSSGPNSPGDVVLDEILFYDRPITELEAAILAERDHSLEQVMTPEISLIPHRFISTMARSFEMQRWRGTVINHSQRELSDLYVRMVIAENMIMTRPLAQLQPGGEMPFEFQFMLDLPLGICQFRLEVLHAGQRLAQFERVLEITPAAEPFENLQVSTWGFTSEREYGLSMGGGRVEETMQRGQYLNPMLHYLCYPRRTTGPEYIYAIDDKQFRPKLDHPYIHSQIERISTRIAQQHADIPAMKAAIINSEMQWLWQHDYAPDRIAWVQETFGLDLTAWQHTAAGQSEHALINPFGRLRPSAANMSLPEGGIVALDHPLYAYHRWFHDSMGPTESYLNQKISMAINAERPDILTIQEPILRRPATKAFDRMQIGQEWFYYQNPMTAVMIQEKLNAATRNTPLRFSGMPQFLFKQNTVAPYAAAPTADLYHQTVWLCALHPIRMFTYWNFNVVPEAGYENPYHLTVTKEQLDAFFGTATPTWEEAAEILAEKMNSEDREVANFARKMFPWTPELIETFTRFHTEEVGPLGALIPNWQNRPRKVAVVVSFANQLWHEVRWPGASWLENNAVYSGVPFDVLYDYDFETEEDVLRQYDMIIVSRTKAITEPAHRKLLAYAQAGGTIVIDAATTVAFPGAVMVDEPMTLAELKQAVGELRQEIRQEQPLQTELDKSLNALIRLPRMLPKKELMAKLDELERAPVAEAKSRFVEKLESLKLRVEAAPLSDLDFTDTLRELEEELTRKYGGPDNYLFVEEMSRADFIQQLPDLVSEQYKQLLEEVVQPDARSLTAHTWLNVLQAEGADYIGIVNDLRTVGPMYGHFGKIREQGVPQTAQIRFSRRLGSVVYDLLQHQQLHPLEKDLQAELQLEIEGGGARLLMLTNRPIEQLAVELTVEQAEWGDHNGKELTVAAVLTDRTGTPVQGIIPATVTVMQPDGSESGWSRHHAFRSGKMTMTVPVTAGVEGDWQVIVFERASGKTATATFRP